MQSVIVLDLDATLVNTFGGLSDWPEVEGECRGEPCKRFYSVCSATEYMLGAKRPHLDYFLQTCFATFDVVGVWSAGTERYVNEIVVEIFKRQYKSPDFVWSKFDCVTSYVEENDVYVRSKPLSKLWSHYPNLDKKRTLLIDDAPDVCYQNPLNHILIPPWGGKLNSLHKPDDVLKVLADWMTEELPRHDDFRPLKVPNMSAGFHHF